MKEPKYTMTDTHLLEDGVPLYNLKTEDWKILDLLNELHDKYTYEKENTQLLCHFILSKGYSLEDFNDWLVKSWDKKK